MLLCERTIQPPLFKKSAGYRHAAPSRSINTAPARSDAHGEAGSADMLGSSWEEREHRQRGAERQGALYDDVVEEEGVGQAAHRRGSSGGYEEQRQGGIGRDDAPSGDSNTHGIYGVAGEDVAVSSRNSGDRDLQQRKPGEEAGAGRREKEAGVPELGTGCWADGESALDRPKRVTPFNNGDADGGGADPRDGRAASFPASDAAARAGLGAAAASSVSPFGRERARDDSDVEGLIVRRETGEAPAKLELSSAASAAAARPRSATTFSSFSPRGSPPPPAPLTPPRGGACANTSNGPLSRPSRCPPPSASPSKAGPVPASGAFARAGVAATASSDAGGRAAAAPAAAMARGRVAGWQKPASPGRGQENGPRMTTGGRAMDGKTGHGGGGFGGTGVGRKSSPWAKVGSGASGAGLATAGGSGRAFSSSSSNGVVAANRPKIKVPRPELLGAVVARLVLRRGLVDEDAAGSDDGSSSGGGGGNGSSDDMGESESDGEEEEEEEEAEDEEEEGSNAGGKGKDKDKDKEARRRRRRRRKRRKGEEATVVREAVVLEFDELEGLYVLANAHGDEERLTLEELEVALQQSQVGC